MQNIENPRAVIGDNVHADDATASLVDRLSSDYGALTKSAALLLDSARSLGETVENERELEGFSNTIVAIRDAASRAEAYRVSEKEPYLRSGQAVDGFFNSIKERLEKGRKVLQGRVDDYQRRKLAAERERRRLEAERQAREAKEAREREDAARREAEERRLAAERARKPEIAGAKAAIADEAEQAAASAAADATVAQDAAETARIEALRKGSDMSRSRFDGGRLVTTREVGFCELVDRSLVDLNELRPYFTETEIAKAARGWAKATGYTRQMPGLDVGKRDEAVVR